MDKLQLAINLVIERAKQKRDAGSIPAFLGVRGMLALMYDRIVQFSNNQDDNTDYVLDLVVNGLFAFASVLPDIDIEEPREEEPEVSDILEENPIAADDMQTGSDKDPRWTPVPAAVPLPVVKKPAPAPQYDPDEDDEN